MFTEMDRLEGDKRDELFRCLVATLAVHETAEEEVVHPIARRAGGDANAVVEARLAEEGEAKTMLSELEALGPSGDGFDHKFSQFRSAVLAHAEAEEHQLFPLLEKAVDEDTLRSMTSSLKMAEKMAPTHPHPHAPESAVGNMVLGPFVAVADRVRDALRGATQRAAS
jgi:hemerythrin superfamily protein